MRIKLKNKEIDIVSRDEMQHFWSELSKYLEQINKSVNIISANQKRVSNKDYRIGSAM